MISLRPARSSRATVLRRTDFLARRYLFCLRLLGEFFFSSPPGPLTYRSHFRASAWSAAMWILDSRERSVPQYMLSASNQPKKKKKKKNFFFG